MLREGMFLGDRYEILERIGVGGMAEVHRAKCHKLNRLVAIKVLKKEYCGDTNFVTKFKAEAQAAAGLSHPNVVNIYDVGDEGDIHYIVMELVEGITLKQYIEKKGKLDIRESIGITIQIAQGIGAAHEQHIVHRDIKPQNIIISKEGKVKVTDFGIAKAASSQTINSDAVGSVYYFSPEQARGGYSDERSDIYSLGITLYEMLTGRVPFEGDTTVAVALAHLNNEMLPPRQLDPTIPISLEKIIMKATQKKPERRYASAAELIADLRKALLMPDEDFVIIPGIVSDNASTVVMSSEDLSRIKQQTSTRVVINEEDENLVGMTHAGAEVVHLSSEEDEEEDDNGIAVLDRIIFVLGIIIAVLILCFAFYFLSRSLNWFGEKESSTAAPSTSQEQTESQEPTLSDKQVKMPSIVGMNYTEAITLLKNEYGLGSKITWETSEEYEKNQITWQEYEVGTILDKNTMVNLRVSEGSAMITIPDNLVGKSSTEVQRTLARLELNTKIEQEYHDTLEAGLVIRTSPSSGKVKKGDTVTIVVSLGKEVMYSMVPELRLKTIDEATTLLLSMNLSIGEVEEEYHDTIPEGQIISQDIQVNTSVEYGTKINVVVSLGSEYVEVPDLSGMTLDEAEEALEEVGLKLGDVDEEYDDEIPAGEVISWDPEDGKLKLESKVDIVISMGVEMVKLPSKIKGQLLADVQKELEDLGLKVTVEERETEEVSEGYIISCNYSQGTEVPKDAEIFLVVAVAPPTEAPTTQAPTTQAPTEAPTTAEATTEAPTTLTETTTVATEESNSVEDTGSVQEAQAQEPEGQVAIENL